MDAHESNEHAVTPHYTSVCKRVVMTSDLRALAVLPAQHRPHIHIASLACYACSTTHSYHTLRMLAYAHLCRHTPLLREAHTYLLSTRHS